MSLSRFSSTSSFGRPLAVTLQVDELVGAKPEFYDEDTFKRFLELDKNRAVRSGRSYLLLLVEGTEILSLSEGGDE